MLTSYRDAITTLHYTDLGKLRARAQEFVEDLQARCREEERACDSGRYDAREEAESWLRELGGPWFALSSFVLPGWTWAGFPITLDKKPLVHVNWLMMRLADFEREVERYRQSFDAARSSALRPDPAIRQVLEAELARLLEADLASWELYDSIQTLCSLMLEALNIPRHELIDGIVKGFIAARPPSEDELSKFVEDLVHAVDSALIEKWGSPPYSDLEEEVAQTEGKLRELDWFVKWAEHRLAARAHVDDAEGRTLEDDLEGARREQIRLREELIEEVESLTTELEVEIEQVETDWISADDRDSVVTGERLDRELVLKQHKLSCLRVVRGDLRARRGG